MLCQAFPGRRLGRFERHWVQNAVNVGVPR
jgi:hypothetical protein